MEKIGFNSISPWTQDTKQIKSLSPTKIFASTMAKQIAKDNLSAALSFVDKLKKRCQDAADYPVIGHKRNELQPGLRGYEAFTV